MNLDHNKKTYAVIPIEKANLYIKVNHENARKSLDGIFLIWDQTWDPPTLEALKNNYSVILLDHQAALNLMKHPNWARTNE